MSQHLLREEPMFEDEGYRPDTHMRTAKVDIPPAEEIVEQLSSQAMKFRAVCQERINQAQAEVDYWTRQHDTITHFLVRDQLSGPISGPVDRDMPAASRMRREMEN